MDTFPKSSSCPTPTSTLRELIERAVKVLFDWQCVDPTCQPCDEVESLRMDMEAALAAQEAVPHEYPSKNWREALDAYEKPVEEAVPQPVIAELDRCWAVIREGLDPDAYREGKWDLPQAIRHRLQNQPVIAREWFDIKTAPKDGTDVLTFGMAGLVVARWEDEAWRIYNYGYEDATVRKTPTHWQPLPAPPDAAYLAACRLLPQDEKDEKA